MPHYLYRLQPTRPAMLEEGPTEREAEAVRIHFQHLKERTEAGQVLLAGRTMTTGEDAFGIVIFEAAGDDEAQAFARSDPAVAAGVMSARCWPFSLALQRSDAK
jgi:uncharacterized protein YciI